jgi:serine phosphatase RsbU (regulator of sigma subunit)
MKARQTLRLLPSSSAETAPLGTPVAQGVKSASAKSALEDVGAREALNALTYGAYVTDSHRTILFWSDAAASITGWSADEVVGHSCADGILIHVNVGGQGLCAGAQCPLRSACGPGDRIRQPMLLFAQHKQGHRIPVEVSVAPLCDRTGQQMGAVEVFRDLTHTVEELRRAKIIQDYILHWELPADERVRFEVCCRPEEFVGGDFHRIQAIGDGRYAIMVADPMGHGLISALYTVHLRSAWEESQAELASPARFLGRLNQRLHRLAGPEGYFATAVFLVLDVSSGRLLYAVAGHPSPLVFPRTGPIEILPGRSPAVGLLDSAAYRESEWKLEPGDQLLLFTDGATELANRQGEILGEAGFLHILHNRVGLGLDLAEIERKLVEFVQPSGPQDDLTLLSIQFLHGGQAPLTQK